jgi:hypothetical protein
MKKGNGSVHFIRSSHLLEFMHLSQRVDPVGAGSRSYHLTISWPKPPSNTSDSGCFKPLKFRATRFGLLAIWAASDISQIYYF